MDKRARMLELRKALQFFLETLDADTDPKKVMEVASVYPAYKVGVAYKTNAVFSYGLNAVGDPQLYQVLADHTSQANWEPGVADSLYKAIGVTAGGVAVWVQPLGASDAYAKGDEVEHNGVLWVSNVDGNVWEPGVYGWTQKE